MDKEHKVLTRIHDTFSHVNSGQLGRKDNDECYTSMTDIYSELSYWAGLGKFRGKNIICPCDLDIMPDSDIYSITITYLDSGIKVVANAAYRRKIEVVSLWEDIVVDHDTPIELDITEDKLEDFFRDKLTCNFVRVLTQIARSSGIKSITASGFNPASLRGISFEDIDYGRYDICITNPPFSLAREFNECVVGKIDFIMLSPFTNRTAMSTVIPLMEKKMYLGHGIHLHLDFMNPTKANIYNTAHVACDWLTSYPEAQASRDSLHFKSGVKYEVYKDEYVSMPNMIMKDWTHPIRVPVRYPEDYEGWMFAGINVLDYLDQSEYEWYATNCFKYFNQTRRDLNPLLHPLNIKMYELADGSKAFSGILFRKKQGGKHGEER